MALHRFNTVVTIAVLLSVGLYFWEVALGSRNSLEGHMAFLWAERILAGFFTFEIVYQLRKCKKYLWSGDFWIDLIAVFPFWAGFVVPPEHLGIIRSLRVARLFKLFWSCDSFVVIARTFKRSWGSLKTAGLAVISVCLLGAAMMFQVEPETFDNSIGNAVYFAFTSAVTVGFGDYSPTTPAGKFITVIILFGPALLLAGTVVGVIGAAYTEERQRYEKSLTGQ